MVHLTAAIGQFFELIIRALLTTVGAMVLGVVTVLVLGLALVFAIRALFRHR